jgi:hypothetical protein
LLEFVLRGVDQASFVIGELKGESGTALESLEGLALVVLVVELREGDALVQFELLGRSGNCQKNREE